MLTLEQILQGLDIQNTIAAFFTFTKEYLEEKDEKLAKQINGYFQKFDSLGIPYEIQNKLLNLSLLVSECYCSNLFKYAYNGGLPHNHQQTLDSKLATLKKDELPEDIRVCDSCEMLMKKGYCVDDGDGYYCSDECLNKVVDKDVQKTLRENDQLYYTEW